MLTNYIYLFQLMLLNVLLVITLSQGYYQTMAQLEIPEAKPVESNEATSANASDFLIFKDLGYKIEYPADWEVFTPGVEYALTAFQAPDRSTVTVKFIPSDVFDANNIEELLELFQEGETQNAFVRNSTTTLAGLPALIESGVYTFTPNVFESLSGEQGYTDRVYLVWGHSESKDGFYGVLFNAAGKLQYDETLPVAKQMIDSFTVDDADPIQDTREEAEEADDTFVGSAGNDEDDDDDESDVDENN